MLLFFVIVFVILAYIWLKYRYTYWERRGVKGPKPIFFFGNLFESLTFQEHFSIAQRRWHNTYNDVPYIGFYKLLKPAVMIRDPELQREVLVKEFMSFHENDNRISDKDDLLQANPFFNNGEQWRRNRAMFGSFFSSNKIRPVFPCMLQVGKEWKEYVDNLGRNAEIDAKNICARFTTETMLRCTFSINGKSFESKQSDFLTMGKSLFNPDLVTGMKAMISFIVPALQSFIKFTIIPERMSRHFKELIRDQIRIRDSGSVQCEDVLQFILNGREKYEMNETTIAGVCVLFFIEAYETSSNGLVTALYLLAQNQHIQDELARRLEESIAENNDDITFDLIHKHEYLEKVLFETMRIHPTIFGVQKVCTKPFTMPLLPGQKEPVTIPAGTSVLVPFESVSQDPTIFSDPDVFDPERFSPEQKALRQKSAFMPFSDGPRMCVGMHLALFNLKMGLFQMIRNFDIKLGPNQKPFELHPIAIFNTSKHGIKLIFTPRVSKTT